MTLAMVKVLPDPVTPNRDGRQWRRAVAAYQRGLEADDLAEELYRGLMRCYQRLGRRSEAVAVYQRCRETLAAVLAIAPSQETERLYRASRG